MRAALLACAVLAGQALPPEVAFDAASIKTNRSGALRMSAGVRGRTYTATNMPLRPIIAVAYELAGPQSFRLLGGPPWIGGSVPPYLTAERFDITATMPESASVRDLPRMLRALLVERFKLSVHTEARDTPMYALVVARSDGRLGSELRRATDECDGLPTDQKRCTSEVGDKIVGRGQSVSVLARMLSPFTGRPVIDQTGLAGRFDFDLQFPELAAGPAAGGPGADAGGGVFTAVQEQLGLKLIATRGPLEFVVIDDVEHPTEN